MDYCFQGQKIMGLLLHSHLHGENNSLQSVFTLTVPQYLNDDHHTMHSYSQWFPLILIPWLIDYCTPFIALLLSYNYGGRMAIQLEHWTFKICRPRVQVPLLTPGWIIFVLGSPEFKYFSQLFWLETEDMVLYTDIFQGCNCFSMVQKLQWAEFALQAFVE